LIPRLRDLANWQLYKLDSKARYSYLSVTIQTNLVRERWDEPVQMWAVEPAVPAQDISLLNAPMVAAINWEPLHVGNRRQTFSDYRHPF
jgi:hypothetical protein